MSVFSCFRALNNAILSANVERCSHTHMPGSRKGEAPPGTIRCGPSFCWNGAQPRKEENPATCYASLSPEDTLPSEISQSQADGPCAIPLARGPRSGQTHEDRADGGGQRLAEDRAGVGACGRQGFSFARCKTLGTDGGPPTGVCRRSPNCTLKNG